jgi:hypothetical protein
MIINNFKKMLLFLIIAAYIYKIEVYFYPFLFSIFIIWNILLFFYPFSGWLRYLIKCSILSMGIIIIINLNYIYNFFEWV